MKHIVYGGLFGSEGKGCVAEHLCQELGRGEIGANHPRLVITGDNSPNSGHTCSLGKTRNLPASSFYADTVLIGPDAVIDCDTFLADLVEIQMLNKNVEVYVHDQAACLSSNISEFDKKREFEAGLVERIGSTGSGSGYARHYKQFNREENAVVKGNSDLIIRLANRGVRILNRSSWLAMVNDLERLNVIGSVNIVFECGQGVLLDVNHGYFPYVTSRSTLPAVAVARNGWWAHGWTYHGVFRTFPIRTGGHSGPTAGREISWDELNVEKEIATVTKRVRRVFELHYDDLDISFKLQRPDVAYVTHCDYVDKSGDPRIIKEWLFGAFDGWPSPTFGSWKPSEFNSITGMS
jgi:adenylosuccinate synthase